MRIVEKITDFKYLNLFKVEDSENNVGGYFYAERLGKDSVAFVCYDEDSEEFLLNNEYKPPNNRFILGAFGGSLDKSNVPAQIVINECEEEAGFRVKSANLKYLGRVFVSTQMNQYCHLYLVSVDRNKQGDRKPETEVEAMATTKWVSYKAISELEDWKAITIVSLAERKGVVGLA